MGFTDLIGRMEGDSELFHFVLGVLEDIQSNVTRMTAPGGKPERLRNRLQAFSDSIVITGSERWVIETAAELFTRLLPQRILLRGYVTAGQLYHDGSIVFGRGLIDAYRGESTFAFYPRILISDTICAWCRSEDPDLFNSLIKKDRDGMYFIDILSPLKIEGEEVHYFEYLGRVRNSLMLNLQLVQTDERRRSKVAWFVSYFNDVIKSRPESGLSVI